MQARAWNCFDLNKLRHGPSYTETHARIEAGHYVARWD